MKLKQNPHICSDCYDKISSLGFPCTILVDLAVGYFLQQKFYILTEQHVDDYMYKQPLLYLERKGYLVSTENDDNSIQIIPNLSKCSQDYTTGYLCWCEKDGV